jgi:hypothetical protein
VRSFSPAVACRISLLSGLFKGRSTRGKTVVVAGEGEALVPPCRRIVSSQEGSDRLLKFFTLLDFSTAHNFHRLTRHDPICLVLSVELLQFYYSSSSTASRGNRLGLNRILRAYNLELNSRVVPVAILRVFIAPPAALGWWEFRLGSDRTQRPG